MPVQLEFITGSDGEGWCRLYFEGTLEIENHDDVTFVKLNKQDFLDAADMMAMTAESIKEHENKALGVT